MTLNQLSRRHYTRILTLLFNRETQIHNTLAKKITNEELQALYAMELKQINEIIEAISYRVFTKMN